MSTQPPDDVPENRQDEADRPTQDTVDRGRDQLGAEPQPGDGGGHA